MNNTKSTIILSILLVTIFIFILSSCAQNLKDLLNSGLETTKDDSVDINDKKSGLSETNNFDISTETKKLGKSDIRILMVDKDTNQEQILTETGGTLLATLEIGNKKYLKVQGATNIIYNMASILRVEEDQKRQISVAPNDPYYTNQYAPQVTGLEDVWLNYTGAGVKVAVLDSGVNTLHEDFGGATAFAPGYDYINNKEYTTKTNFDFAGHGTLVAGVIAARKNNGKGIAGVAPDVIIIPYKVAEIEEDSGKTIISSFASASGIKAATDANAKVINMSFGGPLSNVEADAVQYAIQNNVTLVSGSGNNSIHFKSYPASLPGVIAVGAIDGNNKIASFSTKNSLLSVVAPGVEIYTLESGGSNNNYGSYSGTSLSAPFVSGVVALLYQKFPSATPAQIKSILETTALDLGPPGFDITYGWGKIRPVEALATATLPTATFTKVEFTITYNTNIKVSNYAISIYKRGDTSIIYNILTDSAGKGGVYLPEGSYGYISSYYGVSFNGDLTVESKSISLTKNFETTEFNTIYRVSTFYSSQSVDTVLELYKKNTTSTNLIFKNDDKSTNDKYSEIYFQAKTGEQYEITVSTDKEESSGFYHIIIEQGIHLAEPPYANIASDVTNSTASPKENIALTLGVAQKGAASNILNHKDIDYFTFTGP